MAILTSPIATGGYETFYGLQKCPFDLEPDTRMVFESQSYLTALDETVLAIRSNTPLIVVTGDIGTGKTLICCSLTERLTNAVLLSEYAEPPSSSEEFLAQLAGDLGGSIDGSNAQSGTSRHDLLARCRDLLHRLASDDVSALIVVDEAHDLQPELFDDMRELLSVDASDPARLQILLVGRPELVALLEAPGASHLAQHGVTRLEVRPLRNDEIGRYVDRRLWVAQRGATLRLADTPESDAEDSHHFGNTGEPFWRVRFAASAIRRVAQLSGGVPILVNLVCDRALHAGRARHKRRIGPRQVLAAARDLRLPVPLGLRFAGTSRYFALSVICLSLAAVAWRVSDLNANGRSAAPASVIQSPERSTAPVLQVIGPLEETDGFLILVARSETEMSAMSVTDRLLGLGLPAFTRATSTGRQQVVVGPYLSLDEAEDARQRLPSQAMSVSEIVSVTNPPEE